MIQIDKWRTYWAHAQHSVLGSGLSTKTVDNFVNKVGYTL